MWGTGTKFREHHTADENSVKPGTCSNRTSAYRSFVFYTRVGARRARCVSEYTSVRLGSFSRARPLLCAVDSRSRPTACGLFHARSSPKTAGR